MAERTETAAEFSLPIIHIDRLAEVLGLERRWIIDNWLKREEGDKPGPAPHFRDGHAIFFSLRELDEWAKRRSYGSDYIDIPTDPSD